MKLLPESRRGRVALAVGLAALLALGGYWYVLEYRPWEAHYRLRPTSWWAAEARRWEYYAEEATNERGQTVDVWVSWTRQEEWWDPCLTRLGFPPRGGLAGPDTPPLCDGDPGAAPALRALLRHPDWEVRVVGAYGLGKLGPQAGGAVPDLLAALGDADAEVRRFAHHSLTQIDPAALNAYYRDHPGGVRGVGDWAGRAGVGLPLPAHGR